MLILTKATKRNFMVGGHDGIGGFYSLPAIVHFKFVVI